MGMGDMAWSAGGSHRFGTVLLDEFLQGEGGHVTGPERALMSALLFDGVITCMNYAGCDGKGAQSRFREAYSWIMRKGAEYIFSFENVCDCLGIDPNALRFGLINAVNSRRGNQKKSRRNF